MSGRLTPIAGERELLLVVNRIAPNEDGRARQTIRAVLDAYALVAASVVQEGDVRVHLFGLSGHHPPEVRTFRDVTREHARAYLASLVTDPLRGRTTTSSHGRLRTRWPRSRNASDARTREIIHRAQSSDRVSSSFGPVHAPNAYPPPDPAEARAIAARRCGIFVELKP